jgi:hypothetical protein
MNKGNERSAPPWSSKEKGVRFIPKRFLELRSVLFWFAVIYCVSEFISAMQERDNPFVFSQWMFVRDLMVGPLLMLMTSVLILIHRLSTTALAMALASYLIYVTAYRGLVSVPNSHGVPTLSLDAVRILLKAMPENLILLGAFSAVALVWGTVQLWLLLRKRNRLS